MTGPEDPKKADPRLHIPIADRILCCLPLSFRRKLWCGVPHHTKQYDDDGNYMTEEVLTSIRVKDDHTVVEDTQFNGPNFGHIYYFSSSV